MSLSAATFAITSVEDGRLAGFAVVCVDTCYASARWVGAERLDRLHIIQAGWKAIGLEIGEGLNPGPIPTDSVLYMALAGERAGYVIVRWLGVEPVAADRPEEAVQPLDAKLAEVMGRSFPSEA